MKKINFTKINPSRDWRIITIIFALGLLALSLFAWNVYLSDQVGGGYFSSKISGEESVAKTLDQKKLKDVISTLEKRQPSLSRTIDPSL